MFYCVINVYILIQLFENSLQCRINTDDISNIICPYRNIRIVLEMQLYFWWYNNHFDRIIKLANIIKWTWISDVKFLELTFFLFQSQSHTTICSFWMQSRLKCTWYTYFYLPRIYEVPFEFNHLFCPHQCGIWLVT